MKLIGLHIEYGLTHDKKNVGLQLMDQNRGGRTGLSMESPE